MEKIEYCPECQVGISKSGSATYYTWIEDELITVPNFPCWICDVCGRREWDSQSLMNLNLLLAPNAGKPQQRKRRKPTELTRRQPKNRRSAIG